MTEKTPTGESGAKVTPDLSAASIALVQKWLVESAGTTPDESAARLAGVLRDPQGLEFTVGFIDGVMRPEDPMVAGHNLQKIARKTPSFLPLPLRAALGLGGRLGPVLPWLVIPAVRAVLRKMVGHLVVDASPDKLGPAIIRLNESGDRLNINLLGEAVLGEAEALRRLAGTRALLARDDVDYVSIKVSAIASQLSMWSFDEAVDRVVERLTPLYKLATGVKTNPITGITSSSIHGPKFINLDMEEYRDLDLTIAVFQRLLDQPRFKKLKAGIVLQAYLPDALGALQRLTEWAQARRAAGGAPIKVRLVKGANLAMEHVDATVHGWPLASYDTKQHTDTNYKRVLNWALTPENTDAVHLGIAGHNLFDVAWAHLLATQRRVSDQVEFEMLLGMATSQAAAVRKDVGRLVLYTPVVNPAEFDVAITYLVRRLEENASSENFMSAVFDLAGTPALFDREKDRFLASLAALAEPADTMLTPRRTQDRRSESRGGRPAPAPIPAPASGFHNEPDTDPSLPTNRAWGRDILARVPASVLGRDTIKAARIGHMAALDALVESVAARGAAWSQSPAAERARVLHRAGDLLAANRHRLVEVMAAETGKTIAEADPEISEAIDFAHYYAERAAELDQVTGARFVPARLTVVTPPWNFPVAIPAGGVLAALAAGSGVILKPARLAQRTGAVLAEVLWEAGVPRELLALVAFGDEAAAGRSTGASLVAGRLIGGRSSSIPAISSHELGARLVSHPLVERVILTGAWETAQLFRSLRPDLPLLAETSGKNAIIVTPSADFDLAVADVIRSAFGHAGQKCSAASLVIVVGSVAKSKRFLRQLTDAASSLRVGYPVEATSQMGPLIEPARGKLLHALTELGADEKWLLEPRQLDDTGRLWSPGIRTGVAPGSYFHLTEFFGPVLGVMVAPNLAEAIRFQNASDYGLTAGLHSLDAGELAEWIDTVEAGNLYVNRGITGAIVARQPFGGWKRSAVGPGAKAGGPNYLFGLGTWQSKPGRVSATLHLRGLAPRVSSLIEAAQPALAYADFDVLRRSALSDARAWTDVYEPMTDVTGLGVERNLFRYLPWHHTQPVLVRLVEGGSLADLLRVVVAATLSRSSFTVSSAVPLPVQVRSLLTDRDVRCVSETDVDWTLRVAAESSASRSERVRMIGPDPVRGAATAATALMAALPARANLAVYAHPVTQSGRVELLPFVREQALSITAHRFGTPARFLDEVL